MFKPNPHLRPTTDKTRKAIFDMLQGELQDKKVLDLFSGTGALGFEALSNGAAEAMFVEADAFQAREIRNNLGRLGLESRGIVRQEEVSRAIEKLGRDGAAFDFIFIDPPYEKGL
ncbi:MAG: RsmD family RNA methyltransferase, partial [Candidatus Omnitrophica bacterium]|nr:RsmD family RNA methyltransferase [Candidatus Omnitrophota bacterium]